MTILCIITNLAWMVAALYVVKAIRKLRRHNARLATLYEGAVKERDNAIGGFKVSEEKAANIDDVVRDYMKAVESGKCRAQYYDYENAWHVELVHRNGTEILVRRYPYTNNDDKAYKLTFVEELMETLEAKP